MAWKLVRNPPPGPSTPRVLKLHCANFAKRLFSSDLDNIEKFTMFSNARKGCIKGM